MIGWYYRIDHSNPKDLSISLSMYYLPAIHQSIYLPIILPICLSVYLPIILSIFLLSIICLSTHLAIHPSIHPSIHPIGCFSGEPWLIQKQTVGAHLTFLQWDSLKKSHLSDSLKAIGHQVKKGRWQKAEHCLLCPPPRVLQIQHLILTNPLLEAPDPRLLLSVLKWTTSLVW